MVRILLSILLLSMTQALAGVDSNCKQLAAEKGWVNSKGVFNTPKIKKDFSTTQATLVEQLKGWQQIGARYTCLPAIAGVMFKDGNMYIVDMKKFSNFRLNNSQIDCGTALAGEIENDLSLIDNRSRMPSDNTTAVHRTTDGKKIVAGGAPSARDDARDEAYKIFDVIKKNNQYGDLGFVNYCAHQYRMGEAIDQFTKLKKDFDKCQRARTAGDEAILRSETCAGFPKSHVDKLESLQKVMKDIYGEDSKVKFQPLDRLNAADNDIYDDFRDNMSALADARKKAREAMSSTVEDYHRILRDKPLSSCADETEVYSNQFEKGQNFCGGGIPGVQLTVGKVSDSYDAVRDLYRNELIDDLNLAAFGEAAKSYYYLASPEQKLKFEQNPKEACVELAKRSVDSIGEAYRVSGFCDGKTIDMFKTAAAAAKANQEKNFLSKSPDEAVLLLNEKIKALNSERDSFCEKAVNQNGCGEQAQWKSNCSSELEKILTLTQEIQKTPVSPYLFSKKVGKKFNLKIYDIGSNAKHICGFGSMSGGVVGSRINLDWKNIRASELTSADILGAREEFQNSVHRQVGNNISFKVDDRGSKSNRFGAWMCGSKMGMNEKNDLYALNALYRSHPHLAGRLMQGQNSKDQEAFKGVICDALKCHEKVEDGNSNIFAAAQVAAIGLNFIPGIGNLASMAINASISTMGSYSDKLAEEYKRDLVEQGVATNGYSGYDQEVSALLTDLRENASTQKFVKDVAFDIALSLGAMKVSDGVVKPLRNKLAKYFVGEGKKLTEFQKKFLDEISEGMIEDIGGGLASGWQATPENVSKIVKGVVLAKAAITSNKQLENSGLPPSLQAWDDSSLSLSVVDQLQSGGG